MVPSNWMIVDANNVAARCFYGYPSLPVDGRPTGAIVGFLSTVMKLKDEFASTGLAFCFDKGESLRKKVLPCYKQKPKPVQNGSDPMRDKKYLTRQLHELRIDILPRIGMKNVLAVDGYEADDLVAACCSHWAVKQAFIVSSDKDLFQCLELSRSRRIDQYVLDKKEILSYVLFESRYGIRPDEWSMVKAIAGEGPEGDNIPGVEGVGIKTAIKYVAGVLSKTHVTYKRIRESGDLIARNESLVTLPYAGLKQVELREDEDSFDSWRDILRELNAEKMVRM